MSPDLDVRLFLIPGRDPLVSNMCDHRPLPHMYLWTCDEKPVRIDVDGTNAIFCDNEWHPFDPWELLSGGTPLSYFEFNLRWPSLICRHEYLASFPTPGEAPRVYSPRPPQVIAGVPDPKRRSWLTWRGGTMVQRSPMQWKRQ
jgi:hypothetical protein